MTVRIYQNLFVYLSLPKYDNSHFTKLLGYVRALYDMNMIDLQDYHGLNNLISDYKDHKDGYLNAISVDDFMRDLRLKYDI